jgi:hypothetical protein
MALSDPNHTPDPRPTGDLEQLFRQKFAEAEVAPRASLWEQLDHELLVQQNDTYRRRLLGYRWAAAASLLLLAGGGTWLTLQPSATGVASAPVPATSGFRSSGNTVAGAAASRPYEYAANGYRLQPGLAEEAANSFRQPSELSGTSSVTGYALAAGATGPRAAQHASATAGAYRRGYLTDAGGTAQRFGLSAGRQAGAVGPGYSLMPAASYTVAAGSAPWSAGRPAASLLNTLAGFTGQAATGFGRPDKLAAAPAATTLLASVSPGKLATPAVSAEAEQPTPARRRRWKLSAGYAASAFNPNIDYSRASRTGVTLSNSVSFSSADVQAQAYEMAAAEYQSTLQSGLGQQVAVLASYSLNDHWAVETGLTAGQQQATSATSWAFLDGKSTLAATATYDRNQNGSAIRPSNDMSLRNVRYRYQTASVPVNVRYATNSKKGWALYAKVGAAVNVLLKSRTELEGMPEATTTYSLASANSPYRKVLGSVQSGAGVRYQPANATWRLALGPKVEAGLNTLNDRPAGSFTRRSRPYSVGLEASVEFGNATSAVVARR